MREYADMLEIPEQEILDFSANLNPLGSPFDDPHCGLDIEEIAKNAFKESVNYPDNRYIDFRTAAAKFTGFDAITPDNIIPGNGSTEIIRLFAQCVLAKGDKIIVPYPTFGEYEAQCRLQNVDIINVSTADIQNLDVDEIQKAKILFICNPNNPDAHLWTRKEIIKLAEKCIEAKTVLFVDEAFIELADPKQSVADIAIGSNYVFVMRSLTKSFALPGIRLGFGITSEKMANALNKARLMWNISHYQEKTAVALLSLEGGVYSEFLEKSRRFILKEAAFLHEKLGEIWGFVPGEVTTNYLIIDISQRTLKSTELTRRMAKHGILIRDCKSFKGLGDNYIRVAVRTREENIKLIETFKLVFQEWAKEFAQNELYNCLKKWKEKDNENGRKTCEYYPCHFEGQDCTFCYCPFYPCNDTRTDGKFVEKSKGNEQIWSCTDCYIPHIKSTVDQIMEYLMKEDDTDQMIKCAWQNVMVPILEEKDERQILKLCREIKKRKTNHKNNK